MPYCQKQNNIWLFSIEQKQMVTRALEVQNATMKWYKSPMK